MSIINKIGRRKSSVARVYLKAGKGKITINKRDQEKNFPTIILVLFINSKYFIILFYFS